MLQFRIDHVHLRSPDPLAAARFYVDMLGAHEVGQVEIGGMLRMMVDLGGLRLFIEQVSRGTPVPPKPPFVGMEHLGLAVDDLQAVAATLRSRGISFIMEPKESRPGVWIAFIEGPDGVMIELIQRS
jgi:catechol 2,3-dioxygenase-like lactoylglutathione lyase family enzyme